ncbi:MAG: HAMP domain-containing sensor histidine kinase, partial [Nitrososphaeraceae archaeon]|nr:HAMP domain-containing sensor histidine kinase [Nitrososphaeraceae archaeon]
PQNFNQKIWFLNGVENILNFYISHYNFCKESIAICNDYTGPISIKKTKPIWNANLDLDRKGIKIRYLTDIRNENLQYCKEMLDQLKHLEMRHMDDIKSNFTIHDDSQIFTILLDKLGEPAENALFSTQKGMIETHLFTFESLWRQATPAHLRLKALEEGIHPEVLQTMRDPNEIIETAYKLVKSAKEEMLIIFHTANALLRQERAGGINLLIENVVKYKTKTRILVPIEDKIIDIINRLERIDSIRIRNIESTMQTMMTILVVDNKYSLVIELRDDTARDPEQAIGLATYSNSKSTVLSYVSIFDALWKQTELREELMIRSTAQNEFINIAAHELRNPIQPILGLTDVLQHSELIIGNDMEQKLKQQKKMIDIIARNAKRLQRLTEDILDVTKIDVKLLKLNKERFVLLEAIREIVEDYVVDIKNSEKNIIISFSNLSDPGSANIAVVADRNRIKQVMCNLIDNAIKFTEMGKITISTNIDEKHNRVTVNVEDTGKGIDLEILPKLLNLLPNLIWEPDLACIYLREY